MNLQQLVREYGHQVKPGECIEARIDPDTGEIIVEIGPRPVDEFIRTWDEAMGKVCHPWDAPLNQAYIGIVHDDGAFLVEIGTACMEASA